MSTTHLSGEYRMSTRGVLAEYRRASVWSHDTPDSRGAAIQRVGMAMERINMNLASSLSRERTAALELALQDRRRHADRGVVIAPGVPLVDAVARLGIWLRGVAVHPRRTTFVSPHRHREPMSPA
jgi:hypothetical protein